MYKSRFLRRWPMQDRYVGCLAFQTWKSFFSENLQGPLKGGKHQANVQYYVCINVHWFNGWCMTEGM